MEVNPGDVSLEYFQSLRSLGINRLNIGIQSFDDNILKFLGRRHNSAEAIAAINDARKAGFDNIGIDLIYGVHGQNIKSMEKDITKGSILHAGTYFLLSAFAWTKKHLFIKNILEKAGNFPMKIQSSNYF